MAPPRKHATDTILDATRALVLADGPRAASLAAISAASGAPVGTLYHRFGNRDGIVAATWLRALERFQQRAMAAASSSDAADAAVNMAVSTVTFAQENPDDTAFLARYGPGDLLDAGPDEEFESTRARMNAPLVAALARFARDLLGADDPRSIDAVTRAVVDLPNAAIRRHPHPAPEWLADDVADDVRALIALRLR